MIMRVVANTLLLAAATSTLPGTGLAAALSPPAYPSEEALGHYLQGRLLEERGDSEQALNEFYRALLLDFHASEVARRVSEVSARMGEAQRSLEFADRALALDPDDARSLWLKGAALFNLGRAQESLEFLRAAVDHDSSQVEYLRTLARVGEHVDRVDLVARAYERIVDLEDDDGEAWFQLAAARARLGEVAAAGRALAQAVELNPLRPGVFFLQGWVEEGLGHPRQAIDLYRRHLEIHATDQVTRRRLVGLLARQGRYAEAYREARVVSQARPEDPEARELEADLAFRAGQPTEGKALVEKLERQAAEDPERLERVIGILSRNGRGRTAVTVADVWSDRHPSDARSPLLAARARAMAGETEAAIPFALKAVDTLPDSLAPRVLLARLYQGRDRFGDAEQVWKDAAGKFPDRLELILDLALCREKLGDIDGAEQSVREALRREPENPTVLNFLGYLLADHNRRLDEALGMIRRAVEKDPDNGAFVDSMGWVYYRLGRLQDARKELERAVNLTGGDAVVHEHLGDVYKDLRLLDLARDQYRKSLARDAANNRVRTKLSGIR